MNIQRKNSAHHFCIQSEREQTLVPQFSLLSPQSHHPPYALAAHPSNQILLAAYLPTVLFFSMSHHPSVLSLTVPCKL